jgi:hypothetical protein
LSIEDESMASLSETVDFGALAASSCCSEDHSRRRNQDGVYILMAIPSTTERKVQAGLTLMFSFCRWFIVSSRAMLFRLIAWILLAFWMILF